jgi:hypothetical protein
MPLTPPTESNNYQVTAAHTLNHELWNAVLASLQTRLNAAEAALADYEAAVSTEALAIAQGAVDDTIGPQIAALQDTVAALQAAIATAEDQLAALQAGGVPAASVPVSEYSIIGAGNNVDEALAILVDALAAEATARGAADTALSNAIPALASQAEAEAGTNNTKFLTPLRGAQQLSKLVGKVKKDTFTESGTFTKEADDLAYLVFLHHGGGGWAHNSTSNFQSGGGGGALWWFYIPAYFIGTTASVVVGAGGAAGVNSNGGTGGISSFAGITKGEAAEGGKTAGSPTIAVGAKLTTITNVTTFYADMNGGDGKTKHAGVGGSSIFGGGGGGGGDYNGSSAGGTSDFAGDGGAGGANTAAVAGGTPSGGGGGAYGASGVAGEGGRGEVTVIRLKGVTP